MPVFARSWMVAVLLGPPKATNPLLCTPLLLSYQYCTTCRSRPNQGPLGRGRRAERRAATTGLSLFPWVSGRIPGQPSFARNHLTKNMEMQARNTVSRISGFTLFFRLIEHDRSIDTTTMVLEFLEFFQKDNPMTNSSELIVCVVGASNQYPPNPQ